jgi:LysM repeat protein
LKRVIIPTLLFGNLLFSKGVSLKSSLLNSYHGESVSLDISFSGEYRVKKGDTLASIAKSYHIPLSKLKRENKIYKNSSLKVGKIISVPSRGMGGESIFAGDLLHYGIGGSSKPILAEAKKHLGKKYLWAANGPAKFDCSGFTKYVCDKSGIKIPRKSSMQAKVGKKLTREQLRASDLIFFDTSKEHNGTINHCGIYLGNNKFIHASSLNKKVTISTLHKNFYESRFQLGRRVN